MVNNIPTVYAIRKFANVDQAFDYAIARAEMGLHSKLFKSNGIWQVRF